MAARANKGRKKTSINMTGAGGVCQDPALCQLHQLYKADNVYRRGGFIQSRPSAQLITPCPTFIDDITVATADGTPMILTVGATYWRAITPFTETGESLREGVKLAYGFSDVTYDLVAGPVITQLILDLTSTTQLLDGYGAGRVFKVTINGVDVCARQINNIIDSDRTFGEPVPGTYIRHRPAQAQLGGFCSAYGYSYTGEESGPFYEMHHSIAINVPEIWTAERLYTAEDVYEEKYWIIIEMLEEPLDTVTLYDVPGFKGAGYDVLAGTNAHKLTPIVAASNSAGHRLTISFADKVLTDQYRQVDIYVNSGVPHRQAIGVTSSASIPGIDYGATFGSYNVKTINKPISYCYIPDISTWYAAFRDIGLVKACKYTGIDAEYVNKEDWAIGSGAPYDEDRIDLLATSPHSSFIMYHNSCLWSFGDPTEKNVVRVSAPVPYQDVWPTLSFEPLPEEPVAAATLGGSLVIFTTNSIYVVSEGYVDDYGIQHYIFDDRVKGETCRCPGSIAEINGRLIFLGNNDIVLYSGDYTAASATLDKDSGISRLREELDLILAYDQTFGCSFVWKDRGLYLLALTESGIYNDVVLVMDYIENTWWVWRGLNVQSWVGESRTSNTTPKFFDRFDRLYELVDVGDEEFTSEVETATFSTPPDVSARAEAVEVNTSGEADNFTVYLQKGANDITSNSHTGSVRSVRDLVIGTGVLGTGALTVRNYRKHKGLCGRSGSAISVKLSTSGTARLKYRSIDFNLGGQ